jgi:SAM-dependent methyltransferase
MGLSQISDMDQGIRSVSLHALSSSVLHLESSPSDLYALTSLASDTLLAQKRVSAAYPDAEVHWSTAMGNYRTGHDFDHPLNPMRGYLGKSHVDVGDDMYKDGNDEQAEETQRPGPPGYDLIYILDAIYHFPPNVPHFLLTAFQALNPGGTIVFTDILPPALSPLTKTVLSALIPVPSRNIAQRPKSFEEYRTDLEHMGYVDVEIENWSRGVWPGLAENLRRQGGIWWIFGKAVNIAEMRGWQFVAVKARRPEQ